jgi:hypothetical protein
LSARQQRFGQILPKTQRRQKTEIPLLCDATGFRQMVKSTGERIAFWAIFA